jgi:hypothetical protein
MLVSVLASITWSACARLSPPFLAAYENMKGVQMSDTGAIDVFGCGANLLGRAQSPIALGREDERGDCCRHDRCHDFEDD